MGVTQHPDKPPNRQRAQPRQGDLTNTQTYTQKIMHYKNRVRFINYSTNIPFDHELLEYFMDTTKGHWNIASHFSDIYRDEDTIDIFFANRKEFETRRADERNRLRKNDRLFDEPEPEPEGANPDLLGFYAPCQYAYTKPVIFVCPEKIMELSVRLNRGGTIHEKVSAIYPTLLTKVILHELAHWLMDGRWRHYCHCNSPANWLAHVFDDPERDDEWYFKTLNLTKCECHCPYYYLTDQFRKQPWYTVIEESLANAYALKFFVKKQQKRIAEAFVSVQPPEYCAGLCWDLSERDLRATMESWGNILDDWDLEKLIEKSTTPTFLDDMATRLINGEKITTAIDFNWKCEESLRKIGIKPWCDRIQEDSEQTAT